MCSTVYSWHHLVKAMKVTAADLTYWPATPRMKSIRLAIADLQNKLIANQLKKLLCQIFTDTKVAFFMCSASVVCFCMVQTPELNRALGPRNSGLLQYWSISKLISPTVKFAIKLKLNSLPHFQCLWGAFKQLFRAYNAYNHCSAD